jgi:hypothetical protein
MSQSETNDWIVRETSTYVTSAGKSRGTRNMPKTTGFNNSIIDLLEEEDNADYAQVQSESWSPLSSQIRKSAYHTRGRNLTTVGSRGTLSTASSLGSQVELKLRLQHDPPRWYFDQLNALKAAKAAAIEAKHVAYIAMKTVCSFRACAIAASAVSTAVEAAEAAESAVASYAGSVRRGKQLAMLQVQAADRASLRAKIAALAGTIYRGALFSSIQLHVCGVCCGVKSSQRCDLRSQRCNVCEKM